MSHQPEIVRDEQAGERESRLQIQQQVDHLRLHGQVEGRDGFVGDEHRRIERERAGDADALALPSAQRVRMSRRQRRIQADEIEEALHAGLPARAIADAVDVERFPHDVAHPHARIEGSARILKDHLHPPAQLADARAARAQHVFPLEEHFARLGLYQAQQRSGHGRLAAARLAHESEDLSALHGEAHVGHGRHA